MAYDLSYLDALQQRFVRRGTSLLIETYDPSKAMLLDSYELTNCPASIPSVVYDIARTRLADVVNQRSAGADSETNSNDFLLYGDSIVNNNNVNNGLTGTLNVTTQHKLLDRGWFTWANIHLNGACNVVRNSAIAGDNTDDLVRRLEADVLAYRVANVVIAAGINDRKLDGSADMGFATTTANLDNMVSRCRAQGSRVFLCTILPNNFVNGLGSSDIKVENLLRVNDWIRRYCARTPGVVCLDLFSVLHDPATLCDAVSGTFNLAGTPPPVDRTHPLVVASYSLGVYVANQLRSIIKPIPMQASAAGLATSTNPGGNLIRYSGMTGTGGTMPATPSAGIGYASSGTVPDGWWFQTDGNAITNAGHSIAMSRVPRTDFPQMSWWQSTVTWTAAQTSVSTFTQRLLSGSVLTFPSSVVAGDVIDCALEMEYSSTGAGPLSVEFVARQGTTDLDSATFQYGFTATTPTPNFAGTITPGGFILPAGADNIMVRVQTRNLAGTAGSCTTKLGRCCVRKRV